MPKKKSFDIEQWNDIFARLKEGQSLMSIAADIGIPYSTLYPKLYRLGVSFDGRPRGKKFGEQLTPKAQRAIHLFGTELSDAEIGRQVGLSRERIRQLRKKSGLPPSTQSGESCSTLTEEALGKLIIEMKGTKPLTTIAKNIGIGYMVAKHACERYGIPTVGRKTFRPQPYQHDLKVPEDEFLKYFREHLHEPFMRREMRRHFGLSLACVYLRIKRLHERGQITDEEIDILDKNAGVRSKKRWRTWKTDKEGKDEGTTEVYA